jgi:23S rRNA pseudouridine1911/1915/1917 synthase
MSTLTGKTDKNGRLDTALASVFDDLSRGRAQALVKEGAVTVNGKVNTARASKVSIGDILMVTIPQAVQDNAVAQDLPLDILYQDPDIVVLNKSAGVVVHPGPGHPDGTLVNALLFHISDLSSIGGVARPGIVHRLDRGTSGLIVVAKNDHAHKGLSAQFADHSAHRVYLALAHGVPNDLNGRVESYLARHPKDRIRHASTDGSWGRRAVTHWTRIDAAERCSLLRCKLETGRTHQIRVHLTEAGYGLVGDNLYKSRNATLPVPLMSVIDMAQRRPMLHAWKLTFTHPRSGEEMTFTTNLPADFVKALDAVGIKQPAP